MTSPVPASTSTAVLTVSRRDPESDPPNGPWRKAFFAKFGIELLGHKVDLGTSDTNRLVPRYRSSTEAPAQIAAHHDHEQDDEHL